MNCVDYFFENTSSFKKRLLLGSQEINTYQTIFERSYSLASLLNQKLGTGKSILLVSQNNLFFITAYLAILKSGNICIPLSPSIEQDNFNFIIKKTNSELGFISDLAKRKLKLSIACYSESQLSSIIPRQPSKKNFKNDFNGDQIGEIIFTSGSTAIPKGVMLTHNNIISNTDSIIQYLNLHEDDKIMVVLPFFYCYGLSLLHTHIRVGGQLFLNNNFIFLASTIKNLNDYRCTGFAGVPSHFQILLRKTELFKKTEFPYLRYVTQAGGKLQNAFIVEFTQSFPSIHFYVMYGQTEATARLSYLPPHMLKAKLGSLGKGIPGVELRVVDSKGNLVMPGKTGEIIAKGKNIMLGYFGEPKESAKVIRNGWLYTGDLGTIDEDGFIFLTARKKEIIKVGGKRISPKEIEGVIDMIPGVIDCSIEAIEDDILAESIKATIIISDGENNINEEDIRIFCSSKLSHYKIPTLIEIKKEISISPTGKKTYANKNN
jgi:acyl-CoA synthetase (AMP-forming)/AMP-acid ligase II